jgi:hypothetical protein
MWKFWFKQRGVRDEKRVGWLGLGGLVGCAGLLLAGAPAMAAAPSGTSLDERTRNEVLDHLARELESRYVFEDTARKLGDMVRAKRKSNAYGKIASGPALARALTDDLYTVAHDKHLRVAYSFSPLPPPPSGPPPQEVVDQMRKMNGAIQKVEILEGNVGYMRVNGVPFVGAARSAVAAAFAFLQNSDALIIDNRGNGGGDPNTVAVYVSYLSEGTPYVLNRFHWRADSRTDEFKTTDLGALTYGAHKPVFVLNSHFTFSGGEELAYDLQAQKRAVIVGEVSGGGANPGGPVPLGHQFLVNMPGGRPVNPFTNTNWEGVGVKPDVEVPAAAALTKAHALAIARLQADTPDPVARSMLRAVAMKLESIEAAAAGTVTRLPSAAIVGTYVMEAGAGADVNILEKDGRLIQHVDGFPDVALVFVEGNRYRPEGMPEGTITSFREREGKTELLLEVTFGPPTIREKR